MSYRTFFHNHHVALALAFLLTLGSVGVVPHAYAEDTTGASTESTAAAPESSTTEVSPSGDTASVTTGDASATLTTESTTNENVTDTDTPPGSSTSVENQNEAQVTNQSDVIADTGSNEAAASGGASIDTGSAWSMANVVNVVNTNIFNSEGLLYFLNVLMGNVALDVRDLFGVLTGTPGSVGQDNACSLASCDDTHTTVTVTNQNAAVVDNTLTVAAATGDNRASSADGDSTVTTGDAYASANVVNVVNTNIVNSNYLLLSINNFGAFGGDIVFPGADWFRDLMSRNMTLAGGETSVTNTNTATVTTDGEVIADTGNNAAEGDQATITTGDSHAAATIVNQVNTNLFGDSMLFLFRVHGSWAGNVFGLPDGMSWREGPQGVELFLDPSGVAAPHGSTDRLTVHNTNTATVTNNVSVYALTGDNRASSAEGDSTVTTGDAYASANVVNVVNSNILGRNWVLAIFNIFGDWNGNISFGQPDLWVGARAIVPGAVRSGSCFDYEVTVNNLGDAVATDVILTGTFNTLQQSIPSFGAGSANPTRINVGRIAPKGTRLLTLNSCLAGQLAGGSTVTTGFSVTSRETDPNRTNNSDLISITTAPGAQGAALRLEASELTVTKSADKAVITASTSVEYTVVIKNTGGPVYNALLVDTIYNTDGVPMHEQRWGLGEIKAGEVITVGYTTFFNASTTPGVYKNEAFVFGVDRHPDIETNLGNKITSPTASTGVLVRTTPEEPAATETACTPLLTTYISTQHPNDRTDVRELQMFLRTIEHDTSVSITGEYDAATEAAVHALQEKYAAEVLAPWGITRTTGFVYYTTQKKINELWCKTTFPLADFQLAEIEAFKERVQTYDTHDIPLPTSVYEEVGVAPRTEETAHLADATPVEQAATPTEEATSYQVASAHEAIENGSVLALWGTLKQQVASAFSWMKF